MSRTHRHLFLGSSILVLLALLSGCENHDGSQWQRLVCEVESVNAGSPLICAYLNAGSDRMYPTQDDFQPIDIVPVVFHARPYSAAVTLPEDAPHSYFDIVSYDLLWYPDPDAPEDISDYDIYGAPCHARVPVYEEGAVSILIAAQGMKDEDWFPRPDDGVTYSAVADIVFYGHESGSDELIEIRAGLHVTFFGVVIEAD